MVVGEACVVAAECANMVSTQISARGAIIQYCTCPAPSCAVPTLSKLVPLCAQSQVAA